MINIALTETDGEIVQAPFNAHCNKHRCLRHSLVTNDS